MITHKYNQKHKLTHQDFQALTMTLRGKCPYSELFYSECGKIWTRITPNTDTFYAAIETWWCQSYVLKGEFIPKTPYRISKKPICF